jgi:hypothetical protein
MKHVESLDSVLARVGAIESCCVSDRQDVQADSALGLLEETEERSSNAVTCP